MFRKLRFLPFLFLSTPIFAVAPNAGPIIGQVTDNSARLWMEFPIAGEVTINTYDVTRTTPVSGVRVGLEGPSPFVCDVPVSGLQPNRTYRIEVKFDGEPVKIPGPELTIRTAPPPGDETAFTLAFGGGLHIAPMVPASQPDVPAVPQSHKIPIFSAITAVKPRAFLFLGNTGELPAKLADFPITNRAAYRFIANFHSAIRREPDLQELFRTVPSYAVFSDRDFGPLMPSTPAAGDASYPFAQESLVAFQRFWPNPDWGTPANPGCFCTFSIGDIDFFLLDSRTFRSPVGGADSRLFGDAQLAWLEKNLKSSKAAFKILAAPSVLWGDDPQKPAASSWARYPAEQHAFLKWLADNRIDGVIALAGGQPSGQLRNLAPTAGGVAYPLFSLESADLLAEPGTPAASESFGTLDFGGAGEHRFVMLRLRDTSGKTLLEQTLLAITLHN